MTQMNKYKTAAADVPRPLSAVRLHQFFNSSIPLRRP